jgi:hypothetical protein
MASEIGALSDHMDEIEIIPDFADGARWNRYVDAHPTARLCRRFEYGCVAVLAVICRA